MLGEQPCKRVLMTTAMFFECQIHRSAATASQRAALHQSLAARSIQPRMHYETTRQAQQWLLVHRKYSPVANTDDTPRIYENAAAHFVRAASAPAILVVSLGCGGGQKDLPLLRLMQEQGRTTLYLPCDISSSLVIEAATAAQRHLPGLACAPVVLDLDHTEDLLQHLDKTANSFQQRFYLFFGILPNAEPAAAAASLRHLLRNDDILLASANLVPGSDHAAGLRQVLPQYDNPETRDWLMTLLTDLGVPSTGGTLHFEISQCPSQPDLARIVARFRFKKSVQIHVDERVYPFHAGEDLQLFFSNRHSVEQAVGFMQNLRIQNPIPWINQRGDEIVVGGMVHDRPAGG